MSTTPDLFNALRDALSSDRIESYRRDASESTLDLLERYFWNAALSEALYPALQVLEVALRNNIHDAASQLYQTSDWLTRRPSVLHRPEQDQVKTAVGRLQHATKPVTAGRIVAELSFGFWTSLLDRRYERRLWPRLLPQVFPHLPRRRRTRHTVSVRTSAIRRLRNRVFHHEPIWHWHDLQQQHHDLLEAIGWLDPALADTVLLFDRFTGVYARGGSPYRRQIEHLHRNWP